MRSLFSGEWKKDAKETCKEKGTGNNDLIRRRCNATKLEEYR